MFPALLQTFICLLILCFAHSKAQATSDDPPTRDVYFSPTDSPSDFPVETRYQRASESNNFHKFHQQIAPLSRVLNAYYVKDCLLTGKCPSDAIITELVNIADVELMKKLGNVKTSKISSAILRLESFPHAFSLDQIEQIQDSSDKLADIEAKWRKMAAFTMPQTDLTTHSTSIDDLKNVDLKVLAIENPEKILKTINAVLSIPKSVTSKAELNKVKKILKDATGALEIFQKFLGPVITIPASFSKFAKRPEFLDGISNWNTFLSEYISEAAVIESFKTILQATEPDLTIIQQFATQNSNDSSIAADVDNFRVFTVQLQTSRDLANRTHTPAFPRGARDLKMVFGDVTSGLIQKALGKNKKEILSSLQPIEVFAGTVATMESELYAVGVRGALLRHIETVAEVFADMEKFKTLPSFSQLLNEVLPILDQEPEIQEGEDELFAEIYTGYEDLVKHATSLNDQLGQAAKTKNIKSLSDLTDLISKLEADGVNDYTDMNDMIAELLKDGKLKTVISVFSELKSQLPGIKSTADSLADTLQTFTSFHDEIEATSNRIVDSSRELKRFFDSQKSTSTSFQSLLNGIPLVMSLAKKIQGMATSPSFYKETYLILGDMDAAVKSSSSLRSVVQSFPKESSNDVKYFGGLDSVLKASAALGDGSKLVQKLGDVFDNMDVLDTVLSNCDSIGEEIGKLKSTKVSNDIMKDWRDSKKVKTAIEKLKTSVSRLNKELSQVRVTDLKAVGNSLSKLKNFGDPNLDFASLLRALTLLDATVSNSKVTDSKIALSKLASLDLSFSSDTSSLSKTDPLATLANHVQDSSTSSLSSGETIVPPASSEPFWTSVVFICILCAIVLVLSVTWCLILIIVRDRELEGKALQSCEEGGKKSSESTTTAAPTPVTVNHAAAVSHQQAAPEAQDPQPSEPAINRQNLCDAFEKLRQHVHADNVMNADFLKLKEEIGAVPIPMEPDTTEVIEPLPSAPLPEQLEFVALRQHTINGEDDGIELDEDFQTLDAFPSLAPSTDE